MSKSSNTERSDILQILENSKTLINKDSNDEAHNTILKGIGRVLKSNFLPMLDLFLESHISVCSKLNKNYDIVTDYFIRLAPQVRTSAPSKIMTDFLVYLSSKAEPMQFTLPKHYRPLFPIKFSIRYDEEKIIAGAKVNILTTIISNITVPISIDDVSYVVLHDSDKKEKEEIISIISDKIELSPRKPLKLTTERCLPPAISTEVIRGLILKVKSASIRIPLPFCPKLSVTPDNSACGIDIQMPNKCIIGSHLPVKIQLTAADQKIERLNILLRPETETEPAIEITGKLLNEDIIFSNKPIDLPDIEPFQSMSLEMSIFSKMPYENNLIFVVGFGTAQSGTGEFTRKMPFQFQSPFTPAIKLYDDNFIEIPSNTTPLIEPGVQLTCEVKLTNTIDVPIKIINIESSYQDLKKITSSNSLIEDSDKTQIVNEEKLSVDDQNKNRKKIEIDSTELPAVLNSFETFTFLANIKSAGNFATSITYDIEGSGSNTFPINLPEVRDSTRHVLFTIESPPSAVLHEEFGMKIVMDRKIKRNSDESKDNNGNNDYDYGGDEECGPEVVPLKFEIGNSHQFFINGPTKKHTVNLFRGQKKEINLKFFPLEAGSTTLPQILVTDASVPNQKPKVFLIPIVITYQ